MTTAEALAAALTAPDPEGPVVIPRDAATGTTATGTPFQYRYMMGTLALVLAAVAAGARPGELVTVRYWRFTPEQYRITPTGGGDRTPGSVWAEAVR